MSKHRSRSIWVTLIVLALTALTVGLVDSGVLDRDTVRVARWSFKYGVVAIVALVVGVAWVVRVVRAGDDYE